MQCHCQVLHTYYNLNGRMRVLPKILVQFPRLLRGRVRLYDEKKFKHVNEIVSKIALCVEWMAHSFRYLVEEFVDS